MLMKGQTTSSSSSETSASVEQDKYIMDIVKLTKPLADCLIPATFDDTTLGTRYFDSNAISSITPLTNRRRFANKIEKAVQNFRPNFQLNASVQSAANSTRLQKQYSEPSAKFNTISHGTLSPPKNMQTLSVKASDKHTLYSSNTSTDNHSSISQNPESDSADLLNESFNSVKKGAPLYIICERAQIRTFRSENCKETRYTFIPVDTYEVRETKNCFKKFFRACVPGTFSETNELNTNNHSHNNQTGFLKLIQDSKWFEHLQKIISISNLIVDRMSDSSSVMICLEDGWDITAQLSSIVQLLQDSYYRTIEGFSVLVEREWLSLGHRFTRRNNHTIDDQTGFAPVFLQFLDAVHQIHAQYPHDFEFNEFYLEFLAFHYVSNRFRTFLLDSEFERVQFGLTPDTSRFAFNMKSSANSYFQHYSPTQSGSHITCIWEYIQKVHFNSPKFYNFYYTGSDSQVNKVLKPSSDIWKMKLWRYYVKESLCTGPIYDLDLISAYILSDDWYPVPIKSAIDYKEDLNSIVPSQFEYLIKEIMLKFKTENNHILASSTGLTASQINWKLVWDYFCKQVSNKIQKNMNFAYKSYADQHCFERCIFSSPTQCTICNLPLKQSGQSIGFKCKSCSIACHEKCIDCMTIGCVSERNRMSQHFPNDLQIKGNLNGRYILSKATKLDSDIGSVCTAAINTQNLQDSSKMAPIYQSGVENEINWLTPSMNQNENQTYTGYLKKQGAFFKQWKERFFVLDSVKHQLRYYDSDKDGVVKGLVDLSDVESIVQSGNSFNQLNAISTQQSKSKSLSDDKCCFELKTSKRVYFFCAKSAQEATKWVDLIESCIDS